MISSKTVKQECDKHYGLDIGKKTRKHPYTYARSVYYTLCGVFTNESLESVAQTCGGRDHATTLHGRNNYQIWEDQNFFKQHKNAYHRVYSELEKLRESKKLKRKFSDVEQVHKHYKQKFNVLLDKNVRVRKNLNKFSELEVLIAISKMDDNVIKDFKRLAQDFYTDKRKESSKY